jgi:WD40 repeat protein
MSVEGGVDGLVKVWNLDVSCFCESFTGHTMAITCLDVSSDGAFAVSGGKEGTLKVWSITLGTVITTYRVSDRASPWAPSSPRTG